MLGMHHAEGGTPGPSKTDWVQNEGRSGSDSRFLVTQLRVDADGNCLPPAYVSKEISVPLSAWPSAPNG